MKRLLALCMLAAPAAAHADTCLPRATLDALAKDTWEGAAMHPTCTALRGREPLIFVVDIAAFGGKRPPRNFDPMSQAGVGHAAIVDAHGAVRWHQISSSGVPADWYDWQVVDLDGDGRDELLTHHNHFGHTSSRTERLSVYTLDTGEPAERPTGTLPLADHVSAKGFVQNSCTGTYRLVRDGRRTVIEIVGKRGTDPTLTPVVDIACAEDGKHVYRWTGKGFVEQR